MKIAEGTTHAQLVYDTEHARIEQYANIAGAVTMTFYLNDPVSGAMSEAVSAGGQYTWKTFFLVDGNIVAQRLTVDGSSTVTMKYFVLDHLGSVAVVTDDTGNVVSGGRNFFDAWGAMRNNDGTPDTSCSLPLAARTNTTTTRGYTGQEQMPDVCLDNYNARIYDPQIGRFMSADDIVPDAYYSQSYNRYTYVENGPLSFTDPTGHMSPQPPPDFGIALSQINTPEGISELDSSDFLGQLSQLFSNATQSGTTTGMGNSSAGITATSNLAPGTVVQTYSNGTRVIADPSSASGLSLEFDGNSELGKKIAQFYADGGTYKYDVGSGALGPGSTGGTSGQTGDQKGAAPSLTFLTVSGGPGQSSWRVLWALSEPSPDGGKIIQQINVTETITQADGTVETKNAPTMWEAWTVLPGHTNAEPSNNDGYDDDFLLKNVMSSNKISTTVTGTATFYEGLHDLPSSFQGGSTITKSGNLKFSAEDPHLPTLNATAPVYRTDTYINPPMERW